MKPPLLLALAVLWPATLVCAIRWNAQTGSGHLGRVQK